MMNEVKLPAYEAFHVVSEQLKYWMHQDVSVQEAMEALDIKPSKMYGIGYQRATWFDLGIVMVKEWKNVCQGRK